MDQQLLNDTKQEIVRLLEEKQIQSALPLIRQLAHWGDPQSQQLAVDIYLHGLYGMPKNPWAAIEYVRLAALNQDDQAMYELAVMYRDGNGADKDLKKAFYYMNKAAQAGNAKAWEDLAMMLATGKGCEKDLEQALSWIEKAAARQPDSPQTARHLKMIQALIAKGSAHGCPVGS